MSRLWVSSTPSIHPKFGESYHNTVSTSDIIRQLQCIAVCGRGHFAYCGKLRGARWRGDGLPQEASELPRIIAQIAATCQFSKPNAASELCQMIGKNSILPKSWSVNQRQTAASFPRQNRIRSSSDSWLPYYEYILYIGVRFPSTGILAKMLPFFFKK